tara:strand:+ start:45 stop:593 length:549 start_codon:yes stop_codon:yes gene_type:complete
MLIAPKVKPKLQLTLLLNKLNLFIMLKKLRKTKLTLLLLLKIQIRKLQVWSFMTNKLPVKLRLPITKLLKSIETNHNAMFRAQFQKTKKIFHFADQLNQQPLPSPTTKIMSPPTHTKSTLHTVKASLSLKKVTEKEMDSVNIEEETVLEKRTTEKETVLPHLIEQLDQASKYAGRLAYTTVK